MLDALYLAWKDDTEWGQTSLMIAGDLSTDDELNDRARADRVAARAVSGAGLAVAGGGTVGVGDLVISRQNDRRLSTGQHWVRNGDRWVVTATHHDGTMTVQRANGGGVVVLPAAYVSEHLELAYASSTIGRKAARSTPPTLWSQRRPPRSALRHGHERSGIQLPVRRPTTTLTHRPPTTRHSNR